MKIILNIIYIWLSMYRHPNAKNIILNNLYFLIVINVLELTLDNNRCYIIHL